MDLTEAREKGSRAWILLRSIAQFARQKLSGLARVVGKTEVIVLLPRNGTSETGNRSKKSVSGKTCQDLAQVLGLYA
jgi:hypothetical protein